MVLDIIVTKFGKVLTFVELTGARNIKVLSD